MDTALINTVNKSGRVPPPSGGLGSDITLVCLVFQAVLSDSDTATGTPVLGGVGSDRALGAVVLQAFWSASGSASGLGNATGGRSSGPFGLRAPARLLQAVK
jgi:hypothetical protein